MTLGQKLRAAREKAGLTQRQAAGDRITRNMLSQIENDLAMPSMKTLEYLAATLGVTAGWLLADDASDAAAERLPRARALLREHDYAACLALLEPDAASASDEELLILAVSAAHLAEQALDREDDAQAHRCAALALAWDQKCLYSSSTLRQHALAVLARCAQRSGDAEAEISAYREAYLRAPEAVRCHLLLARYHLEQEHIQAAEREIWSIADLPEASRAEYLILRGRIAAKKEQFENARLYLQQAEETSQPLSQLLQRELYHAMELCAKETGDYQTAYSYAAKQLALK